MSEENLSDVIDEKDIEEILDSSEQEAPEEEVEQEESEQVSEAEEEQEDEEQKELDSSASDFEQEARAGGWCPKEEWKGNPDLWKPAQQFVEDGKNPYFKELHALKKENKALAHSQKLIYSKFHEISKKEYEKAKADLTAKRDQAIVEGEIDKFHSADKELSELKAPEENPEFVTLTPAQEFFKDFPEIKDPDPNNPAQVKQALKVKRLSEDFCLDNPNASEEDEVNYIRMELAKMSSPKKDPVSFDGPSPSKTKAGTKVSKESVDLASLKKRAKKNGTLKMAQEVEAQGIMSLKEYLISCAESGAI